MAAIIAFLAGSERKPPLAGSPILNFNSTIIRRPYLCAFAHGGGAYALIKPKPIR